MPIYEYECGHCHCRFDMKQGFDEEPQAMCPQCHGRARRVFHATPVIFKGSGFYVTDSRKRKEPEAAKSGTGDGKGKAGDGKGKAEAGKSEKGNEPVK